MSQAERIPERLNAKQTDPAPVTGLRRSRRDFLKRSAAIFGFGLLGAATAPFLPEPRPVLAVEAIVSEPRPTLYNWDGMKQVLSELEGKGEVPRGMGPLNESAASDKLKVLKASVERIAPRVENRAQYYQDLIDYTENSGLKEIVERSLGNNRYLTYKDKLPFYGEFEGLSSEVRTVEDMVRALKQNPTPAQYDKVQERLYQLGYKCPGPIESKELNNGKITVIDKYNVTNQEEFDKDAQRLKDFIEANGLDFIYKLPADIQITSSKYGPDKVPVPKNLRGSFQIIEKGGNFRYKIIMDMDPRKGSAVSEQAVWAHEIFTALMYTKPYMMEVGDNKLKTNPILVRALPASSMGPLIRSLFEFFESDSVKMGKTIPEIYERDGSRRSRQEGSISEFQFRSIVTEYADNGRIADLENRLPYFAKYASNPGLFDQVLAIGQEENGYWLDKNGFLWSIDPTSGYKPGPDQDKNNRITSILLDAQYLDKRRVLDLFPEEQNQALALAYNAVGNEALGNLLSEAASLQTEFGLRLEKPTNVFSLSQSVDTYLASR